MPTFAETSDIAIRVQRTLSDSEEALAEQLLAAIGDEILETTGRDEAWATALEAGGKIEQALKGVSIEAVSRMLGNPASAESLTEQLGSYSYTQRFRTAALSAGLYLTEQERRRVRFVVYGRTVASTRMESIISTTFEPTLDPDDPVSAE